MENTADLKNLEENLIKRLNEVRDIMDKQNQDLQFSIRKDVVAVQLKEIIQSHSSFFSLRDAIEDYIDDLYKDINIIERSEANEINNKE